MIDDRPLKPVKIILFNFIFFRARARVCVHVRAYVLLSAGHWSVGRAVLLDRLPSTPRRTSSARLGRSGNGLGLDDGRHRLGLNGLDAPAAVKQPPAHALIDVHDCARPTVAPTPHELNLHDLHLRGFITAGRRPRVPLRAVAHRKP